LGSAGFLLLRFNVKAGLAVKFAATTRGYNPRFGRWPGRSDNLGLIRVRTRKAVRPFSMSRAGNLACFDLLLIVPRHGTALRFRIFVGHYFALSAMNLTILRNVLGFTAFP
jgi:hypothetical protein